MRLNARLLRNTIYPVKCIISPSHIISSSSLVFPLSPVTSWSTQLTESFESSTLTKPWTLTMMMTLKLYRDSRILSTALSGRSALFQGTGNSSWLANTGSMHCISGTTGSLVKMLTGQKGETLLDTAVSC